MNTHFLNKKAGILSIALATFISGAAIADINETIEKTFDFDSDGEIELSNINGDVTINACDCSEVTLVANITASSQEVRDRISVEIKDSANRLSINTKYQKIEKRSWNNNSHSEVVYTLSVPNDVKLDEIDLVNGDLTLNGVTGSLNADLVNGSLKSDGLTASTKVDMVNGNIDIHFSDLSNADRIELESVNGDITVYLPSSANATINAETVSGKISNEFGLQVIKHKYVGSEMNGVFGGGDVRIDLENVNGRIAVKVE
jgi:hypothetical protein